MATDNKTIGLTVRFFTNHLPDKVGSRNNQTPVWTCGAVYIEANKTKGISSASSMFNYIDDIPRAIREVLSKSKVVTVEDIYRTTTFKNKNK